MGVILYVLLAGFLPFDEPSMSTLFSKIQAAEFSYPRYACRFTSVVLVSTDVFFKYVSSRVGYQVGYCVLGCRYHPGYLSIPCVRVFSVVYTRRTLE